MKKEYTINQISEHFEKAGEIMDEQTKRMSEEMSHKLDLYVSSQIKSKPKWFISDKLWKRVAGYFLQINIHTKI